MNMEQSRHQVSCQPQEKIAIVGIGCRFPGKVSGPSALWELLSHPVDLSAPVPSWRFRKEGFYHENASHRGTTNSRGSYFLEDDDVKAFDAQFFNISPQEAEAMDPQHRLLLEVVYEGLEDAGISLVETSGTSTAAYVGLMSADWQDLQSRDIDDAPRYLVTGGARSIASNRLSYFFNWHGPSETIDTACSSSLVAVHHAVQALQSGEARMAVAAGTNLLLAPEMYVMTSNLNMLSHKGKCHMWSSDADGYTRGEGVACVVLKTLSSAVADGDDVYGVIRGIGINQDGRTTGITMPSSAAQSTLIRNTYAKAGLDITRKEDQCQFFEAHGTGTPAGDPLEAESIWNAFFSDSKEASDVSSSSSDGFYVGSIKTVIGHLEGCAGLAGLIKAALSIQRGFILPNLHLGTPNSRIAPFLGPGKISVATDLIRWPKRESGGEGTTQIPRRASVNSFGFGGTNCHAILESFDDSKLPQRQNTAVQHHVRKESGTCATVIIVLSAAAESSLAVLTSRYADYIEKHPDVDLKRLALTTQRRRSRLAHGVSFVGSTRAGLVRKMRTAVKAFQDGGRIGVMSGQNKPSDKPVEVLGVFTGQGAQWVGMGAKLLDSCPIFARTMIALDGALAKIMAEEETSGCFQSWSLLGELRAPVTTSRIALAEFAMPLSTAVQVALVDVLRAAGVSFSAVVGHSSGELAATYASGLISATDCVRIAYYRGRFATLARSPNWDIATNDYKKGGMMAVGLSVDEARVLCAEKELNLSGSVWVAADNSAKSTTLSGDVDKLKVLQAVLRERNVPAQMLKVDKAYHSPHMARPATAYRKALERCELQGPPQHPLSRPCTWVSSVYTDLDPIVVQDSPSVHTRTIDVQYWVENLLSPVFFREAIEKVASLQDFSVVLEVGPHPALRRPVGDTCATAGKSLAYHGTLNRGSDDCESLGNLFGFLWQHGVPIDLGVFESAATCEGLLDMRLKATPPFTVISGLPTLPWQHNRVYWRESAKLAQFIRRNDENCLLGYCVQSGSSYGSIRGTNGQEPDAGFALNLREWSWRHILRLDELPWLSGHRVQGQVVFPAAGYCVLVMEAVKQLTKRLKEIPDTGVKNELQLEVLELREVEFGRAVVFPSSTNEGVSVSLHLHDIQFSNRHKGPEAGIDTMDLSTAFYIEFQPPNVGEPGRVNNPHIACFGRVVGMIGPTTAKLSFPDAMPSYIEDAVYLHHLSTSKMYKAYADIGLEYSKPFQVETIERCLGRARSTVKHADLLPDEPESENDLIRSNKLCFPVALIDTALHTCMAGFSAPGDGKLLAPYLPRSIHRLRVDLAAYESIMEKDTKILLDASLQERSGTNGVEENPKSGDTAAWMADVEGVAILGSQSGLAGTKVHRMIFQVKDVKCVNLVPTEGPYQEGIFSEEIWRPEAQEALSEFAVEVDGPGDSEALELVEELTHYYMCEVYENFGADEAFDEAKTPWFIRRFWEWLHHRLAKHKGNHEGEFQNPWRNDSDRYQQLMRRVDRYKHRVEVEILRVVAQNILRVMRQQEGPTILEVLFQNEMLPRLYTEPIVYARANRYLGRVAGAISHQFPRCKILEIGAGTGGATRAMFAGLNGAYSSYTFTDISSSFFTQAKVKLEEADRIIFKTLDVEKDPIEQGFPPAAYDVVVASNVLHATKDIEQSLVNARKLLKPGGYLLLLEITDVDKVLVPFLMGAVPGWWLFEDKWRTGTFSPLLTVSGWDQVLQEVGFTGTEFVFNDMQNGHLSSVMVARAMEEDWNAFQHGLATSESALKTDNLMIVRGSDNLDESLSSSGRLAAGVVTAMSKLIISKNHQHFPRIAKFDSLEAAAASPLLEHSVMLVLSDLDKAVLDDTRLSEWEALKDIFGRATYDILWVTRGRIYGHEPKQNMIVGLGRCARSENPALKLQFIDLGSENCVDTINTLALITCQALIVTPVTQNGRLGDTAWVHSLEPELAIEKGRLMIPRLVPLHDANNRYLARRAGLVPDDGYDDRLAQSVVYSDQHNHWDEAVSSEISSRSNVEFSPLDLQQLSPPLSAHKECHPECFADLDLCVSHPHGLLLSGPYNPLFISLSSGKESQKAVVLSAQCPAGPFVASTQVSVFPLNDTEALWTSPDAEATLLSRVVQCLAACIVFQAIEDCGKHSAAVMVVEPKAGFERALTELAKSHKRRLYVVTSTAQPQSSFVTYLHPGLLSHRARSLLSKDRTGVIVDSKSFKTPGLVNSPHFESFDLNLPVRWKLFREGQPLDWLASTSGQDSSTSSLPALTNKVSQIVENAIKLAVDTVSTLDTLEKTNEVDVLDWRIAVVDKMPAIILPNPQNLFRPDRTYLFAGITSDLGLLIARWMVQNGAQSLALTSRNPKIPPVWLQEMSNLGAKDIRIFSMDVTDSVSVNRICDTVSHAMPPVGGVVFGAMSLHDTLLENMSLEALQTTLAPKVTGIRLVDDYFHDTPLDFFIFMSSVSAVVGIRGQSNYNAANMYGRALVANRRARGLAASSVDLSTVYGVGHLANAGASTLQTVNANLEGFNTLAIGEAESIDAFHEAILRGPPEASSTGEVIVGLGSETAVAPDRPAVWHNNPRFAHFTARANGQNVPGNKVGLSKDAGVGRNPRAELKSCKNDEARLAVLSSCFVGRIQEIMQLSESTLRMDVPLTEMGIDSLISVDLRGWFVKELQVNVPVLSILNGESVEAVCRMILTQVQDL